MSLSDLCTNFIDKAKLKDETERNIIEFASAPWGLGMGSVEGIPPLFPVQKFIFKCYYNIPLSGKERNIIVKDRFNEKVRFQFNELEYLHFLHEEGRINVSEITGNSNDTRPNLVLVIGRRGCKSSSIAVLVAFETYKLLKKICPQSYYNIMPDQEIRISCIATNQEQASELFRMITGHLERSEYFRRFRNKPTQTYMQLSTSRDIEQYGLGQRPSIRIVASPCSGRGLRGHNNIIAVLDEMAYFFESETSLDKSDSTIYDAVTPSTAKFSSPQGDSHGRVISISSPASRSGKFFELYQRSFESDCQDLLMVKAPTWEVDYTLSPKILRAKYAENPTGYDVEYGANFSDRVSGWLENEQMLRANIIPGLKLKKLSYDRTPHFMGIDVGLKNDGTAVAITHIEKKNIGGIQKNVIELDAIDVRYAFDEEKEFFTPEEIAEWLYSFTQKFFIVKGIMDQYYGMAIIPLLTDKNVKQIETVHVSRDYSSKIYQNLMTKILDNGLRIPESEERIVNGKKTKDLELITELLTLQMVIHSKYLISVKAPQIKGMHDDLSDAYARSVYLASEYLNSGGGVNRNNIMTGAGKGKKRRSYLRYMRKQKRNVMYTNRPSKSLQAEIAGQRTGHGIGYGNPFASKRLGR